MKAPDRISLSLHRDGWLYTVYAIDEVGNPEAQDGEISGPYLRAEALLSDETVERAAEAVYDLDGVLFDSAGTRIPFNEAPDEVKVLYRRTARAALEAAVKG